MKVWEGCSDCSCSQWRHNENFLKGNSEVSKVNYFYMIDSHWANSQGKVRPGKSSKTYILANLIPVKRENNFLVAFHVHRINFPQHDTQSYYKFQIWETIIKNFKSSWYKRKINTKIFYIESEIFFRKKTCFKVVCVFPKFLIEKKVFAVQLFQCLFIQRHPMQCFI